MVLAESFDIALNEQLLYFFMSSGLIFLWAVNNAETQFSTPPNPRLMKIVITPEESKQILEINIPPKV